jgi:hypothetical protein
VELFISSVTYYVVLFYRPPNSNVSFNENFKVVMNNIKSCGGKNILCIGDLNLPEIDWESMTGSTSLSSNFTDICFEHDLSQINKNPSRTTSLNILDVILTNFPSKLSDVNAYISSFKSDHLMIECTMDVTGHKTINQPSQPRFVYQFKDTNFDQLNYLLYNANLEEIVNECTDVNKAWYSWKRKVVEILDKNVKKVKLKGTKNSPWLDGEIIHMSNLKSSARKKALKSGKVSDWVAYRNVNNRIKCLVRKKYNEYLNNSFLDIGVNPKKFWNIVNCKKQHKSLPDKMYFNNTTTDDSQGKADLFNLYFTSQFNNVTYPEPVVDTFVNDNLSNIVISVDEVYNVLLNLDVNKCNGPEGIPVIIYKRCAEILAPSLCLLYNSSLNQGVVPHDFKCANVIPVYKKDDASNMCNYRPISILPTAEKVFEKCIHNIIFDITRNDINVNQHGFMNRKSTTTQLLEFYNYVHDKLDKNSQVDVAFLDLSKAFDRVPHNLLLLKLKTFGINGPLLNWFKNYLSCRKQCVVLEGHKSRYSVVTSGVPQGSILGPLLFLYYINDIFKCINSTDTSLFLYADDAKIGHVINNVDDCKLLQSELESLYVWCNTWGMAFNVTKCVFMSFSKNIILTTYPYNIRNVSLNRVTKFTDLGILINDKLEWDDHINNCIKRANMRLGLIKRTTGYPCSTEVKLLCYTSLVRPILEFTSQLWTCNYNKKLMKNLESVQRRATKYILCDLNSSYDERLCKLSLLPLSFRREFLDLLFYYNCIHDIVDMNLNQFPQFIVHINPRTRQNYDDLQLPVRNICRKSYMYSMNTHE